MVPAHKKKRPHVFCQGHLLGLAAVDFGPGLRSLADEEGVFTVLLPIHREKHMPSLFLLNAFPQVYPKEVTSYRNLGVAVRQTRASLCQGILSSAARWLPVPRGGAGHRGGTGPACGLQNFTVSTPD